MENEPSGSDGSGNTPFETKPISGFIVITFISIRSNTDCAPHPDYGPIRRFIGLSQKDDTNLIGAVRKFLPESKESQESKSRKTVRRKSRLTLLVGQGNGTNGRTRRRHLI